MRAKRTLVVWAACLMLMVPLWSAGAATEREEMAAKGRAVLEKYGDAVVTLRLAAKVRMAMEGREMQEEETTGEILATVVDPSGLVVCSLAEADPSQVFATMMGDDTSTRWQMDITDVKVRLPDGKELPAKFVLRDNDLDLAFIRLTTAPAQPLKAIDLSASGEAGVLDDIVVLSRLGEVASRVPAVTIDRPAAIIKKPRLMYVPEGQGSDLGCPALLPDGKVLGVLVNRFSPTASEANGDERRPLTVILPAADVLEAMKQVPKG
jgi:hypothetical protein